MVVNMKVACIQNTIYTGDIPSNTNDFISRIVSCNADVIVLPEMWFCGFDYQNLKSYAKETSGIIDILKSNGKGKIIVSSMPEIEGEDLYNTVYVVGENRILAKYRKQFLFSPQREDEYFKASDNDITVFEYKGVVFAVATCYEIRFPEIFRIGAYKGAEVFLVPAIWPAAKSSHWLTLLKARAIENQAFVVGCSSSSVVRGEKVLKCGYSAAYDPWGEQLFALGEESSMTSAELDISKISAVREQIPSLRDATKKFNIVKL
ncbi:nitrilase-related carbon-nitrogen hydrolase [Calditerrivibrio nitroreducens]|uniref:Nitrilase/cyanide hydratase and apolipoprotein N-acyltransferase n=1 Tax=Calditerrivibrio nitroreducens (strain DSM 19672 / NBRC 101217 / Yu37-1) TaxID=768670 RepID=E4TJ89_CALNY|nr:nitrilase-related carbon-nitrogen hydrolase [Calditerrivibrio nitroreducens]ADR18125.1 Nitrilase/cyanide hydratase and apolipoprotein N-acyltransferase [Calditerrivibrio nitroreducens DSM 19672]